jgi:disulfide bond formation protein DsbB
MSSENSSGIEGDFRFLYAAWIVASLAMLMSTFFSEIMQLPPCTLCWYQRICLFPLVAIFAVGIVRRDHGVVSYALPLLCIGLGISIYHNLLYYGVIPEALSPCSQGASCTEVQLEWLGFITIPMMALAGFIALLGSLFAHQRSNTRNHS